LFKTITIYDKQQFVQLPMLKAHRINGTDRNEPVEPD